MPYFQKNFLHAMAVLGYLPNLIYHIFFPSQDIKQNVLLNSPLDS